jgi:uncharacterized coiled-coil protein SlyX
VIRRSLEAVAVLAIIAIGVSYFLLRRVHQERLAALKDRMALQETLLSEYQTKLKGAPPAEAAAQLEDLTKRLAETQKNLDETTSKLALLENQTRDPLRLYQGGNAIARVRDTKVNLDKKTITFPAITSEVLLEINKVYGFQNWNVLCGGTQVYNAVKHGTTREFSYSPLTCRILGSR